MDSISSSSLPLIAGVPPSAPRIEAVLTKAAKAKESVNIVKRIFNWVLTHIQQKENSNTRLALMTYNCELLKSKDKVEKVITLKPFTSSNIINIPHKNVTTLSTTHFLPLQPAKLFLDSQENYTDVIQIYESFLKELKQLVLKLTDPKDIKKINEHIEDFEKRFYELVANKNNRDYYKLNFVYAYNFNVAEIDLFNLLKTNILQVINNEDINRLIKNKRHELNLAILNVSIANRACTKLNPLISKDNALNAIRLLLTSIAVPIDIDHVSQEPEATYEVSAKYLKAIEATIDKDHPETQKHPLADKIESWNKKQQSTIDKVLSIIAKVTEKPGPYIELKSLLEDLEKELSEEDKKVYLSSIKSLTAVDIKDLLNRKLSQQTQYFSTLELFSKLMSWEQQHIEELLKKAFPSEKLFSQFAFKTNSGCPRELLMRALLSEMGELGQFIAPKFDFTFRGVSLNDSSSPTGIVSEWIKEVWFLDAWEKYHKSKKKLLHLEARRQLKEPLDPIQSAKVVSDREMLLKSIAENQAKLSDPRSKESILTLGFLDVVFISYDSHIDQLRSDGNGVWYSIDFARFLTDSEDQAHLIRSCCLDHPFALEEIPESLITKILQLNPYRIVEKWREKDLIKDDNYFTESKSFIKKVKAIHKALELKQILEDFGNFIPDYDTKITLNILRNELKALESKNAGREIITTPFGTFSEIDRMKEIIEQLERGIKFVAEARMYVIRHYTNLIEQATKQNKVAQIKGYQKTISALQRATTFKQILKLSSKEILTSFLSLQIDNEKAKQSSKLHERSAQKFIQNVLKFQRYLLQQRAANRPASLREGAETFVFPHLKPFLDAVERIEGRPYENFSITGEQRAIYRSLANVYETIKNNSSLFTPAELKTLEQAYETMVPKKPDQVPPKR